MTQVRLYAYGQTYEFDCADETMIGPWIKSIVELLRPKNDNRHMAPVEFRITIQ